MSPSHPRSSVSRRRFLQLVGAASAAVSWPGRARSAELADGFYDDGNADVPGGITGDPERVIVVGSGVSGLAAANALAHAGIDTVVVEGRRRLGGRAFTKDVGGAPIDLGASWIHTPAGNPMTRLSDQLGLERIRFGVADDIVPALDGFDGAAGAFVDAADIGLAFLGTAVFESAVPGLLAELPPGASMRDAFRRQIENVGATGDRRRLLQFALELLYESNESAAAHDISLESYFAPYLEYGGIDVLPVGGYREIIQGLAEDLDIRLGETVQSIVCTKGGVKVRTSRRERGGQARERVIRGSHVVVTLPLGVLKARGVRFKPELPEATRRAIDGLGFGNFEKVVLRFDERFWGDDDRHFVYLSDRLRGEYPLMLDKTGLKGEPILVAHAVADFAQKMVWMTETERRDRVLGILSEMFGGPVPAPTDFAVSNWARSEFTRGAYSYLGLDSSPVDQAVLGQPVHGRVLFAGEATSTRRWGTTDGALGTGVREAKRLLGAPSVRLGRLGSPGLAGLGLGAETPAAALGLLIALRERTRSGRS